MNPLPVFVRRHSKSHYIGATSPRCLKGEVKKNLLRWLLGLAPRVSSQGFLDLQDFLEGTDGLWDQAGFNSFYLDRQVGSRLGRCENSEHGTHLGPSSNIVVQRAPVSSGDH